MVTSEFAPFINSVSYMYVDVVLILFLQAIRTDHVKTRLKQTKRVGVSSQQRHRNIRCMEICKGALKCNNLPTKLRGALALRSFRNLYFG